MTDTAAVTYPRIGDLLKQLGMISEQTRHRVSDEYAVEGDRELTDFEAAQALVAFGVAVGIHAEGVDSIYIDYRHLLNRAEAVVGGEPTVTAVRLVAGPGDYTDGRVDTLEIERNGDVITIQAEHYAEHYFDHEAAIDAVAAVSPQDDPRSFRYVVFDREPGRVYDSIMVLATSDQAAVLNEHLRFTIR